MTVRVLRLFVLSCLPALLVCLPFHEGDARTGGDDHFIGQGTNEIATALLQGYVDKDDNLAYSPFGYSAIMAVFSEGASGASREEIAAALHFPKDVDKVRQAYKKLLERFVEKNDSNSPEFKNWFYIYKNYSVNEDLQNTLRKYYLTEVKYVERPEEYLKEPTKPSTSPVVNSNNNKNNDDNKKAPAVVIDTAAGEPLTVDDGTLEKNENLVKVTDVKVEVLEKVSGETPEKIKVVEKASVETPEKVKVEEKVSGETPEKTKVVEKVDTVKKVAESDKAPEVESVVTRLGDSEPSKPVVPKVDVKTRETVQKPETGSKMTESNVGDVSESKKETVVKTSDQASADEKADVVSGVSPVVSKDEKVSMKKERMVNENKMTEKSATTKTANVKEDKGTMTMEHFSGMTDSSIKIKGKESQAQMIIFNGLYYKGEWETPFEKKPADSSSPFYKSDSEKVLVPTLHSHGMFKTAEVADLDCKAIELPYKGGRYSLLVLVPNERNGLNKLISDLSNYPLSSVYHDMTEKLVDVFMPSFEVNTISKPISSLKKLGLSNVSSIFDPETADLSKISSADSGLYVEELVQMVTFKVEADYAKANFLTASIASSRSNVQTFQVNQPFLFYLRERGEDLTIVNGKIIDPTPKSAFYFS